MNILNRVKALTSILLIASGLVFSSTVLAETAVVIHPSNAATMTDKDIQRIFLGKQKTFPGGGEAIPVDQNKGEANRAAFYETVLEKSEQQVKAYWSRLVFTGKGTPPKEVGNSEAVKQLIADNPNMIGYIDAAHVDASVKAVHTF